MHIIVCLDDQNGMLFNRRRQSRDRAVTADIIKMVQSTSGAKLWMTEYSAPLFATAGQETGTPIDIRIDNEMLSRAGEADYCLVENLPLQGCEGAVRSVTAYRWNRRYPSDVRLDVDLAAWQRVDSTDFPGYSHERITKETYLR